jgi:hypothetical protein
MVADQEVPEVKAAEAEGKGSSHKNAQKAQESTLVPFVHFCG